MGQTVREKELSDRSKPIVPDVGYFVLSHKNRWAFVRMIPTGDWVLFGAEKFSDFGDSLSVIESRSEDQIEYFHKGTNRTIR